MCSFNPEDFMRHVDYIMLNTVMKECISSPPQSDTGVFFYRQNTVNKTLTHPKCANKTNSNRIGPRTGKCFPAEAPYGSPMHRTVLGTRPLAADDVKLPSKQTLRENYTMKVDKKFLKKN